MQAQEGRHYQGPEHRKRDKTRTIDLFSEVPHLEEPLLGHGLRLAKWGQVHQVQAHLRELLITITNYILDYQV